MSVTAPQTNIVFVDLAPDMAPGAVERLRLRQRQRGVLATGFYKLRLVTHLDVSRADVDQAITILRGAL